MRKGRERLALTFSTLPITCFIRVLGVNGRIREYLAALSLTSRYCVMRRGDAARLGYVQPEQTIPFPDNLVVVGGVGGLLEYELIKVDMALGAIRRQGVETLLVDLPEVMGVDMVVGSSFFEGLRATIDYEKKVVLIERAAPSAGRPSRGRTRA
jgi:hypothetical protein